jgi:mRNA-degrading endonuclease YafQ of YafQ-DinJ toxin-antitoxin module
MQEIKNIHFNSHFTKSFEFYKRGLNKKQKEKIAEIFNVFKKDCFDLRLKTHKLGGIMKDLWSFSINYSDRIVFYFLNDSDVLFVDIGSHDEVYD